MKNIDRLSIEKRINGEKHLMQSMVYFAERFTSFDSIVDLPFTAELPIDAKVTYEGPVNIIKLKFAQIKTYP